MELAFCSLHITPGRNRVIRIVLIRHADLPVPDARAFAGKIILQRRHRLRKSAIEAAVIKGNGGMLVVVAAVPVSVGAVAVGAIEAEAIADNRPPRRAPEPNVNPFRIASFLEMRVMFRYFYFRRQP